MNIQTALSSQYKASLLMLRQTVERCPTDVWTEREHPRNPWRIAYHAVFYAHLYLGLYFDAVGEKRKALEHMNEAGGKYRLGYMGDVAHVHAEMLRKDVKK